MPFSYVVYPEKRLVITTASGRVTRDEIQECHNQAATDPEFNPEFDHLADLRDVSDFEMSLDEFKMLARRKIFEPSARRALVARQPHIFGMGRLWEAYSEMSDEMPPNIRVFYDLPSALRWLGLEADPRS